MGVGLVLLIGLFVVTVTVHLPDGALWTLVLIEALAAGAVAEGLTGQMQIDGTLFKWGVRAGGSIGFALAVLWAGMNFAKRAEEGGGGENNISVSKTGGSVHVQTGPAPPESKPVPAGGRGNVTVTNTGKDVTINTGGKPSP
ncbi:MAG TPA: hypothetical protein VIF57_29340 [Polyangia bacterium]|jgi:hypothetical protein